MIHVNRVAPVGPSSAYHAYEIVAPASTHFRKATCVEMQCSGYVNGWVSKLDERDEQHAAMARYIRFDSKREFTEHRDSVGMTIFKFEPGQTCFKAADHRTRIPRPEIFRHRSGDYRKRTGPIRTFETVTEWLDRFHIDLDKIQTDKQRG